MRTPAPLALALLAAAGCGGADDAPCDVVGFVPQIIAAGLWAVEAPPATPTQITLTPNLLLVDGDVTATAGIDLGYAPTAAGDSAFRDVAVELASGAAVDELVIWVDRALPPQVASAFTFDAFGSADNATWTPIPLAAPAAFSAFANRFEIPVAHSAPRYVKVVTRPLALGFTTDPSFRDVFVTEAQALVFDYGTCSP